jgi:uncharacterized protein
MRLAVPAMRAARLASLIGKSTKAECLTLRLANRHGLVTGATGTGKTVTLQVMAEEFSRAGVPVFAADIKGDLSGIAAAGEPKEAFVKRAKRWESTTSPTNSRWCSGTCSASRATRSAPRRRRWGRCCCRGCWLNETQEGVLNIAFRMADEQGLPLLDLKDLRAMLASWARTPRR